MTSTPPPSYGVESKWLLVSHLQKAIRHGKVDEAEWASKTLYGIDAAYLRYRLAVIAAEDVAGGSPEMVARHFSEGWTKKVTEAKGGSDFLVQVARDFASSIKDRTPCTWMGCTRFLSVFESLHGSWESLSLEKARALAWEETSPWWQRGLAAWRAIGTDRFPSSHLLSVTGDWDAWQQEMADRGATENQMGALLAGAKQREAHPVFLGLVWIAQSRETVVEKSIPIVPLEKVGPWLSAALDKHTREGQSAIRHLAMSPEAEVWRKEKKVTPEVLTDAIGRLLFWMEGGLVNRSLSYPTATQVDAQVKKEFLVRSGIEGRALFEAFGHPQLWQAARQKALGITPRHHSTQKL